MATKIAVFSDVHSNLQAMGAVAKHIRENRYDAVYCLGDIGGYAANPNETQELVHFLNCPTVLGNYDEGVGFNKEDCGCHYVTPFDIEMSNVSFQWTRKHTSDRHKQWLRELPREIRINAEGKRILFCHGSPASTTEYLFENKSDSYLAKFTHGGQNEAAADIILFGHTHVPFHRTVNGVEFINTGSVGRPKDGDPRAGYCVLTLDSNIVKSEQIRVEYDIEAACNSIVRAGLPDYFAAYLRTGGKVPVPAASTAQD